MAFTKDWPSKKDLATNINTALTCIASLYTLHADCHTEF